VFINPRPGPAIIGRYYGSDYYAHTGVDNTPPSLTRRIRQRLLDGMGGYDRTLAGRLIHACVPRGAVDIVISSDRRGRLLDVGCGAGERVNWYRERGFDARGIEVSGSAVERARAQGLDVKHGTLHDGHYPDAFFDVVIIAHVLEHTHSPALYLREAARILKPGGVLAVAVPNIESQSATVFKACWTMLMPPLHLYHFSVETLTRYLIKSGFEIDAIVGKTVYGEIATNSVKSTRKQFGRWPAMSAWFRTGLISSGLQQLLFGARKADAVTIYSVKQKKVAAGGA
jgi:2-polyprenyl-3-methyl-5-hydroxy-6-metoxy-1,4-benzoquinol methylase